MAQLSVADPPLTLVPRRPGPTRPERHRPDHLVADDLHRPVRLERRQRDHQLWGGRLRSHRVHQCTPTLPRPISLPMLRVLLLTSSPGPQRYVSPRRIHTLLRGYHAVSQCERDERAAGVRARPDGQWGVCDPKWVQSSEDRSAQISVHLPPSALPLFPSPGPCLLVRLGASGVTALTLRPSHIFYTPCTGIWQSVFIEPVPASHIAAVDISADMDGLGAYDSSQLGTLHFRESSRARAGLSRLSGLW
jgi:hypothetical protein